MYFKYAILKSALQIPFNWLINKPDSEFLNTYTHRFWMNSIN